MDESNWQKQLLIGVVMLLIVGGAIGVVLAVAGLKAADLAGIGETGPSTPSDQRLHIPRNVATSTPAPSAPETQASSAPTAPASRRPPRHLISLALSPASVGAFDKINLSGSYRAPDGTTLQIQRRENGVWSDFPAVTHVSGGRFATYVVTGHTGLNLFRVSDQTSGRFSNPAAVTVH
jgi:hypothetical protein